MPLHLLPKKSWNPYSATAIARVKADEAAAADADRAYAERLAAHEAARRRALLRGDPEPATRLPTPPPPPSSSVTAAAAAAAATARDRGGKRKSELQARADGAGGMRKKARRRAGEDETAWEIRVAGEERDAAASGDRARTDTADLEMQQSGRQEITHDARGHMQLFTPIVTGPLDSRAKKQEDGADGAGMRFKHAAGYAADISKRPWYYSGTEEVDVAAAAAAMGDDGGVVDERGLARERRQQERMAASDPMAAMKKAQGQLKKVEREREDWKREREGDLRVLREEETRLDKRRLRRRELEEREMGGFMLDAPAVPLGDGDGDADAERRGRDSKHSRHRRRSRSREQIERRAHRHGSPRRSSGHYHERRHHERHESRHESRNDSRDESRHEVRDDTKRRHAGR